MIGSHGASNSGPVVSAVSVLQAPMRRAAYWELACAPSLFGVVQPFDRLADYLRRFQIQPFRQPIQHVTILL